MKLSDALSEFTPPSRRQAPPPALWRWMATVGGFDYHGPPGTKAEAERQAAELLRLHPHRTYTVEPVLGPHQNERSTA